MTHSKLTKLYHEYVKSDNSKHRSKTGEHQDPVMKAFMAGFCKGYFQAQEDAQTKLNNYLDKKGI